MCMQKISPLRTLWFICVIACILYTGAYVGMPGAELTATTAALTGSIDAPESAVATRQSSNALQPSNGTDTDGDGVTDQRERELGTSVYLTDTDADGISDGTETNGGQRIDTDGDGTIDALDTDSDGDGLLDREEGATSDGVRSINLDSPPDTDDDGTLDFRDTDADGDGVPDRIEGAGDIDDDGVANYRDTDADGDQTLMETASTTRLRAQMTLIATAYPTSLTLMPMPAVSTIL
jgi:hypothetical protein